MDSLMHTTGFINVNKAAGASSAQEVSRIKKLTKTPCGHMGTLDPMASGVLPVAIGKSARLFDYLLTKHKTYIADFTFGIQSDTLDTTGDVKYNSGRVPSAEEVTAVLKNFTGDIMQVPPQYSAKCVNGKRGYQLAREGAQFTLPPKQVTIYSLKLTESLEGGIYRFEIECGGGTYIRSLARDIASALDTTAAMSALVRTKSGIFTLENSVSTAQLTPQNYGDYIIPADSVIDYPPVYLTAEEQKKLINGVPVRKEITEGYYKVYLTDKSFYGIGASDGIIFKTRTKLC